MKRTFVPTSIPGWYGTSVCDGHEKSAGGGGQFDVGWHLNDEWTAAFCDVIMARRRDRNDVTDLAAELRFRDLEPPYERVADEIAAIVAELCERGTDPLAAISDAIQEFLVERSKPKN